MTIRPSSYQGLPFKWKRDPRRGLVIQGVAPGSGLGKAGFVNGSRLMGVDGVPIMNEDELKVILWCKRKKLASQNERSGAPGVCFPMSPPDVALISHLVCTSFFGLTGMSRLSVGSSGHAPCTARGSGSISSTSRRPTLSLSPSSDRWDPCLSSGRCKEAELLTATVSLPAANFKNYPDWITPMIEMQVMEKKGAYWIKVGDAPLSS